MKKRLVILLLLLTYILSLLSFISLLIYMDPYYNVVLSITLLLFCFFGWFVSILSVIVYFIKKVYFRGEVGMYHILTSLRQSFLLAMFIVGSVVLLSLGIPLFLPLSLLAATLIFIELFLRNF